MKTLRTLLLTVCMMTVVGVQAETRTVTESKATVEVRNSDQPTMAPEVQPKFVGGEAALFRFINNNLQYPKDALQEGKTGKVIVRVVITEDGRVRSARVVKGMGCNQCDQEALRVMYTMPNWIPAQVRGQNVASYYTIPVVFSNKK